MTIVSSVIASDQAQRDGRRWIRELHTDNVSLVHEINYLTLANADANSQLTADALIVEANIEAAEIAVNLIQIETFGSLATITTIYATLSQTITAARAAFLTSVGVIAVNLGDWFNTLTFVQLQTAFGFANVAAYNAFKASFFTPNATTATAVRASVGG
jgi:hypothetical protein